MTPLTKPPAAAPPTDPVRAALDDPAIRENLLAQALALLGLRLMGQPRTKLLDIAQDAVQETCTRATQKQTDYDPNKASVAGWMHGILSLVLFDPENLLRCGCVPLFAALFSTVPIWRMLRGLDAASVLEGQA